MRGPARTPWRTPVTQSSIAWGSIIRGYTPIHTPATRPHNGLMVVVNGRKYSAGTPETVQDRVNRGGEPRGAEPHEPRSCTLHAPAPNPVDVGVHAVAGGSRRRPVQFWEAESAITWTVGGYYTRLSESERRGFCELVGEVLKRHGSRLCEKG